MTKLFRSLALLVALLGFVAPAQALGTIVQTVSTNTASATSLNLTTASTGSGNLLVACVGAGAATPPTLSMADNQSSTWTGIGTQLAGTVGTANIYVRMFYAQSSAAGVTQATASTGGVTAALRVILYEISGQAASALDVTANSGSDNSGTSMSVSLTTVTADTMVLGCYEATANKTFTAGTNYTVRTNGSVASRLAVEDRTLTGTSSETVPMTLNTSGNWLGTAASFKLFNNAAPTITPNTADATAYTTHLPYVEVTPADGDSDELIVEVQFSNSNTFTASGDVLTDSYEAGGSAIIHPNPDPVAISSTTGAYQVDDRPCESFTTGSRGGLFSKFSFLMARDETVTDGNAYVRIYAHASTALTQRSVTSIVNSGSTNTVTATAHGYITGNVVVISGANAPAAGNFNGTYQITRIDANTFTYVAAIDPTDGTATGTILHAPIGLFGVTSAPSGATNTTATPTAGWYAVSDALAFNGSSSASDTWYQYSFTGSNLKPSTASTNYIACLDWQPATQVYENTMGVKGDIGLADDGSAWIDGYNANNFGARKVNPPAFDIKFRLYEYQTLLSKTSVSDAGFLNTVSGGDTSPFTQGQKIRFTVQSGDELYTGTWYWRARTKDPSGSNTYSAYTTIRTITVADAVAGSSGRNLLLGVGQN